MRWIVRSFVLVSSCAVVMLGCARGVPHPRYVGAVRSSDVEGGHARYMVVCAPCHEDHNDTRAPMLDDVQLHAASIRRQVREGDAIMTAIPLRRLSDDELEMVLAFLVHAGTCVADDAPEHDVIERTPEYVAYP